MSDDADDFVRTLIIVKMDSSSDRILISKTLMGQHVIYNNDSCRFLCVLICEEAATLKFESQCVEVPWFDHVEQCHVHIILAQWLRLTVNPEESVVFVKHGRCAKR